MIVSIKVGIILSEKWTFLQMWIFLQHSVGHFWYKMCYQTKKNLYNKTLKICNKHENK